MPARVQGSREALERAADALRTLVAAARNRERVLTSV
jgi:hypothetical protein